MLLEFIRGDVTPFQFLIFVVAAIAAITVHEFAHAVRASQAGDPTPGRQGRLTLNPAAHYDPVGTTMILVLGLGWGRAVRTNPQFYRHPRRDGLMIALWGPLSNILLAIAVLLLYKIVLLPLVPDGPWPHVAATLVDWNLLLAFFNLIPLPPLDGSKVLSQLLPVQQAVRYDRFMAQYGMLLLILLVFGGQNLISQWIEFPSRLIVHTIMRI